MRQKDVLIFSLPGASRIGAEICEQLNIVSSEMIIDHFADGEVFCKPSISVRNKKVILIQSIIKPVNESLMTLLVAIDALKRASAAEIILVIPYYAYARQDRKSNGREPITAKLVADLLSTAGANRLVVVDVHADQLQGFFNFPVDTVRATYELMFHFVNENNSDVCVVSPDYGGVKRARRISELLNVPLAIIDKRRPKPNEVIVESVLGDVSDKVCVLVDDMIDTGGTICNAAKLLKSFGARSVYILATHGLFNANAPKLFSDCYNAKIIDKVFVTNSIQTVYDLQIPGLKIISIASFLADIIRIYINDMGSVSDLYQKNKEKILVKLQ